MAVPALGDATTCDTVLRTLIADKFLARTANGSFIGLPTPQGAVTPERAGLRRAERLPCDIHVGHELPRPLSLQQH
jgi:hypothetical protein